MLCRILLSSCCVHGKGGVCMVLCYVRPVCMVLSGVLVCVWYCVRRCCVHGMTGECCAYGIVFVDAVCIVLCVVDGVVFVGAVCMALCLCVLCACCVCVCLFPV